MKIDLRLSRGTKASVTTTPGTFTQTNNQTAVLVYATVDCHVACGPNVGQSDFFLKAETPIVLHCDKDEMISYVRDSSASDGDIYLASCD
jgi:hypothetical protein